jgi:medium-chain acyl-CoA synthetase
VRHVIQVDEEAGNNVSEGVTDFHKEMKKVEKEVKYEGPKTKATDPAMIYFTSGTSGPPKMVLHNHVSYPLAHTITGKHWLQLKPGKIYWNLSEQGASPLSFSSPKHPPPFKTMSRIAR